MVSNCRGGRGWSSGCGEHTSSPPSGTIVETEVDTQEGMVGIPGLVKKKYVTEVRRRPQRKGWSHRGRGGVTGERGVVRGMVESQRNGVELQRKWVWSEGWVESQRNGVELQRKWVWSEGWVESQRNGVELQRKWVEQ